MTLFDELIEAILTLFPDTPTFVKPYNAADAAPEGAKNTLLFRSDTAYELGGSGKNAVSRVLFGEKGAKNDEIRLYGSDLDKINGDCAFAHVTFVSLKDTEESDLTHEALTDLAFGVYRVSPEGYHLRWSPQSNREQVRVAKTAVSGDRPLSFYNIGCRVIRELKKSDKTHRVTTVFITSPDFDYPSLEKLAFKAKAVTDALQSALGGTGLDCSTCQMKAICDEVEGLRELHIQKEKEKHGK